jgi:hypothetical protein
MKKHTVLTGAETLKATINLLHPRGRPDLIPRLEALLKRDPIQEKTESSPEMFAVDLDPLFAQMVHDELATLREDHEGPESYRGAEMVELIHKWQEIVIQLSI